jgi:hypothetical protein
MMSRIKKFTVIAVLFIVTGCSTVSYQPAGFRGGYSERQLAEQVYRVNYFGNGSVKLEQTIDFIMLRSAVIAQQQGAECFNTYDYRTKIDKVDLGTPGVYAYKPTAYVTVSLVADAQAKPISQCDHFSTLFEIAGMSKQTNQTLKHVHNTRTCIESIKAKYALTEQQVLAKAE